MLGLIETVLAFSVIMIILCYLVKSLTSVLKNHLDYYSTHLRREVERLVRGCSERLWQYVWKKAKEEQPPWLANMNWKAVGENYLKKENIEYLLRRLAIDYNKMVQKHNKNAASDKKLKKINIEQRIKDLKDTLEQRITVHLSNIRYAFEKRTKNVTLVLGLVLCLGLNINAFTIWTSLYTDEGLRGTFIKPAMVKKLVEESQRANKEIDDLAKKIKMSNEKKAKKSKSGEKEPGKKQNQRNEKLDKKTKTSNEKKAKKSKPGDEKKGKKSKPGNSDEEKLQALKAQREALVRQLAFVSGNLDFGMGAVWKPLGKWQDENPDKSLWFYVIWQFLGSLLTGILLSIGAPYWHDLMRALMALRWGRKPADAGGGVTSGAAGSGKTG